MIRSHELVTSFICALWWNRTMAMQWYKKVLGAIWISQVYLTRSKSIICQKCLCLSNRKVCLTPSIDLDVKFLRVQWYGLHHLPPGCTWASGHFIKWDQVKCSVHILRSPCPPYLCRRMEIHIPDCRVRILDGWRSCPEVGWNLEWIC